MHVYLENIKRIENVVQFESLPFGVYFQLISIVETMHRAKDVFLEKNI